MVHLWCTFESCPSSNPRLWVLVASHVQLTHSEDFQEHESVGSYLATSLSSKFPLGQTYSLSLTYSKGKSQLH